MGKRPEVDAGAAAIGERAARLRKDRGITQKEIAESLGVTQAYVSYYERGEMRLHGEMIARLARILGASADELLGLKTATSSHGAPSPKLWRKLKLVSRLPERDQRAVLRLISSLSSARG